MLRGPFIYGERSGRVWSDMTRLQISLMADDRRWLEREARKAGVSMAEIVRRTVTRAREGDLLVSTSGVWRRGDGLRYQRRIRQEWR